LKKLPSLGGRGGRGWGPNLFTPTLTLPPAYRPRSRPRAGQAGVKGEGIHWVFVVGEWHIGIEK